VESQADKAEVKNLSPFRYWQSELQLERCIGQNPRKVSEIEWKGQRNLEVGKAGALFRKFIRDGIFIFRYGLRAIGRFGKSALF
jgi:hypothetical protein